MGPINDEQNGFYNKKPHKQQKKRSIPKKKKVKKKSNLKKRVLMADGFCQYCGSNNAVSAHHIIFKSQGGDDSLDNLICLCFDCHRAVHDGRYLDEQYVSPKEFMIHILESVSGYDRVLEILKKGTNEI